MKLIQYLVKVIDVELAFYLNIDYLSMYHTMQKHLNRK